MTKNEIKLLKITKLLQEVYGNELNNEKNDFEKVFETITDDLRYYLVYETMDHEQIHHFNDRFEELVINAGRTEITK